MQNELRKPKYIGWYEIERQLFKNISISPKHIMRRTRNRNIKISNSWPGYQNISTSGEKEDIYWNRYVPY